MARWRYILAVLVLLPDIFGCQANKPNEDEDLYMKGLRLFQEMKYDEAYRCFGKARTLFHINGEKKQEFQALNNMAVCAFWTGEPDSCIYRLQQALDIAIETGDELEQYNSYSNLYNAYYMKADMERAMMATQKIDSLTSNTSNVQIRFDQLQRLAQAAAEQQNAKLQEHYLLERERMLEQLPCDIKESQQFIVYGNLRDFYVMMGNFDKARKYSRIYIDAVKSVAKSDLEASMGYDVEAVLRAGQGLPLAAFEALDSMKYGLTHSEHVPPMQWMHYHDTRGNVYKILGDWNQACKAYEEALQSVKGENISSWLEYHQVVFRLGEAFYYTGQYDKARRCYEIDANFYKSQFGEGLEYASALWTLAAFDNQQGDYVMSCDNYIKSVEITKKIVAQQLRFISSQKRNAFWSMFAPRMWQMTVYALNAGERQSMFTEKCYEALLFSKALLLESDRSMTATINMDCTVDEQRIYYEMVNMQNELKGMMKDYDKNKGRIDTLHQRITSLDRQLTPIVSRLGYTSFLEMTYKDIKQSLADDEVLIDFTDLTSNQNVHQHFAYIINKEQEFPEITINFIESDLNNLLDGRPLDGLYLEPMASEVMRMIWEPLTSKVLGKRTIYYVPSGLLHQIALESLPMQDGTLLGEHFHFVRLTSAREIAKIKSTSSAGIQKQAIIYGDLRYDIDETTMTEEATHYKVDALYAMNKGEPTRGNGKWGELENGKEEVETICKLLIRKNVNVTPRTGVTGTEESFFAMSGHAPQMLHVSTHGFYYTPEKAKNVAFLNGYQDAMQLSGLILAGGNREWTGQTIPQGVMGGVLTANDIATLDLRGTDLVVLSACQTGLGIATSEGIYGLQRAFKKAGVQTIVMSLWNVSDRVTKEFMVKFYEELTGPAKWDKRKAFEEAKRHIRDSNKDQPYYWAAFVMLD